jgi:hypothetical protein
MADMNMIYAIIVVVIVAFAGLGWFFQDKIFTADQIKMTSMIGALAGTAVGVVISFGIWYYKDEIISKI